MACELCKNHIALKRVGVERYSLKTAVGEALFERLPLEEGSEFSPIESRYCPACGEALFESPKIQASKEGPIEGEGVLAHSEGYKGFSNINCEYYPCHRMPKGKALNCMFCYCPLYNNEACGGNFKRLGNGLKDCSNCLIPHSNYDYIVSKLMES